MNQKKKSNDKQKDQGLKLRDGQRRGEPQDWIAHAQDRERRTQGRQKACHGVIIVRPHSGRLASTVLRYCAKLSSGACRAAVTVSFPASRDHVHTVADWEEPSEASRF